MVLGLEWRQELKCFACRMRPDLECDWRNGSQLTLTAVFVLREDISMVADTHIGAGSVLAGAVGLAQASVCCTLVNVWKEKRKWREKKTVVEVCSGFLSKIQRPSDTRYKRSRLYIKECIFSTFLKPGKRCDGSFASHLNLQSSKLILPRIKLS